MNKIYDLVIKTRTYNDKNGNEKSVWENVGSMIQGDNGPFIMLKAHFNPAALPRKDGSDCISISLFSPKNKDNSNSSPFFQKSNANQHFSSFDNFDNGEDTIPF